MAIARVAFFVDAPNFEKDLRSKYEGYFPDWNKLFGKLSDGHTVHQIHWLDAEPNPVAKPEAYRKRHFFWHGLQQDVPKLKVHPLPVRRSRKMRGKWEESGLDQMLSYLMSAEAPYYDIGFILTADSDQATIVKQLQAAGKSFVLVSFDHTKNFIMRQTCDSWVKLTSEWMADCWRRTPSGILVPPAELAAPADHGQNE